jgi:predicted NBD/HSP70 family sugar kinase
MRQIDLNAFRLAERGTPRAINRLIALNVIRARQPVSRADLARLMRTTRAAVSILVKDLIDDGLVFEGAKGEARRGRKPQFLYIDTRKRCVVAVDLRPTRVSVILTDVVGEPLVGVSSFDTPRDPKRCITVLADRIRRLLHDHPEVGRCEGVGVVVPGMVDLTGSRVLFAPRLDWTDAPLREPLATATGLPVSIENSGKAGALAQMWAARGDGGPPPDFVFLSVSDGLGVGVVLGGRLLRGRHNIGGEFGHVPLNVDGPPCACGARGCWEAYVSNLATLSRYFGRPLSPRTPIPRKLATFSVEDLIARARGGDRKAIDALQSTARYLGLGLGGLINAVDPSRIYVSGEITTVWDLVEPIMSKALRERVLPPAFPPPQIVLVPASEMPRLRGAAALVAAPAFAAPEVA